MGMNDLKGADKARARPRKLPKLSEMPTSAPEPLQESEPEPEAVVVQPAEAAQKKGPGRPPAKRSSEDYRQITTYVKKTLFRKAENWIDEVNDKRQKGETQKTFADVLEQALTEWLKSRGVKL
jgi:hypothetical protein